MNTLNNTFFTTISQKIFDKQKTASIISGIYNTKRNTATRHLAVFLRPDIFWANLIIALWRVGEFLMQYPLGGNKNPSSLWDRSRPAALLCLITPRAVDNYLQHKGGRMTTYELQQAGIHTRAISSVQTTIYLLIITSILSVSLLIGGAL
jgi:hypothetical protein